MPFMLLRRLVRRHGRDAGKRDEESAEQGVMKHVMHAPALQPTRRVRSHTSFRPRGISGAVITARCLNFEHTHHARACATAYTKSVRTLRSVRVASQAPRDIYEYKKTPHGTSLPWGVMLFAVGHAQDIVVGLGSWMMMGFRSATAFSSPSSIDMRLSSCSIDITRS